MNNFQWESCKVCGKDKKYIRHEGNKEILVCKHGHMTNKCTCSSSFQTGMCQWCLERYEQVYRRYPSSEPCLFDGVPKDQPMMLSCSCPKCSPRC